MLLGLASAGLAAVAGNRHWVEWSAQSRARALLTLTGDGTATVPLAGALALVLLACWGVLLVTRGRLRRAVAVLALVVSAGMVATALLGYRSDAGRGAGSRPRRTSASRTRAQPVVWYWVFLARARSSRGGDRRGRAPGRRPGPRWAAATTPREPRHHGGRREQTGLDLWRALDDGRDPTLHERERTDP